MQNDDEFVEEWVPDDLEGPVKCSLGLKAVMPLLIGLWTRQRVRPMNPNRNLIA